MSNKVIGTMLVVERHGKQSLIYYTSKVLQGTEVRYQKIEKLAYAFVLALKELKHYFQAHPIII